jgi:4-hydroxythreonine-4-phosphate dehydrogenase
MDLEEAVIFLVGPAGVWKKAAEALGKPLPSFCRVVEPEGVSFEDYSWGRMTAKSAKMATSSLEKAVGMVMAGEADALVTAPLSKEGLKLSGRAFPGHTELLGAACGVKNPTMMFAGGSFFVSLVTTHFPLREVPGHITPENILSTVRNTRDFLTGLGMEAPRIAVCGLNPHAGENGLLGDEELRVIAPAVETARSEGIDATGPIPADALFYRASKGGCDAVVAMYHDQGLAPFKLLHFHDGVNVTLGLPIIRTSPDHGTAPDIAGKSIADPSSMREAIKLAIRMAQSRNRQQGK